MSAKLTVVVRADLSAGQQAVQAMHALREWVELFPDEDRRWYEESNTLALLAVDDESALEALRSQAESSGYRVACFREPDLFNAVTAVVIEPEGSRLTRRLPLALRPLDNLP